MSESTKSTKTQEMHVAGILRSLADNVESKTVKAFRVLYDVEDGLVNEFYYEGGMVPLKPNKVSDKYEEEEAD